MGVIYLDHLSGTPLHPRVKEAMIDHINTVYGNPVSDHQVGATGLPGTGDGPLPGGGSDQRRPQRNRF